MSDKPREAVRNAGAFLTPDMGGGVGMIPVPVNALNVGPGEPGPEDEWNMPADPADPVAPADGPVAPEAPVVEPAPAGTPNPVTHRG
jgi:hypothetical protein